MASVALLEEEETALLDDLTFRRYEAVAADPEAAPGVTAEPASPEEPSAPRPPLLSRVPRRVFLFLAVILLLAVGLVMTATAQIDVLFFLVCYSIDVPEQQCLASPISGQVVTSVVMWLGIFLSAISLIFAPWLSTVSDRIGRKKVLIYAIFMHIISQSFFWWIMFGGAKPRSYWWVFLPQMLTGLGGNIGLLVNLSVSYLSDSVTDPKDRPPTLALCDAAIGIGVAVAPSFGSWVLRTWGLSRLFMTSIGVLLGVALLAIVFLEESLPESAKKHNDGLRRSWSDVFDLLWFRKVQDPIARRNVRILFVCSLVGMEFILSLMPIIMVYVKQAFAWSAIETGYLVTASSTLRSFMYIFTFPALYAWLSKSRTVHGHETDRVDAILVRISLGMLCLGFANIAIAKTPLHFVLGTLTEASSSMASPVMKAALIKQVAPTEFGSFMACYSFLSSLMSIFVPALFLRLYGWAYTWFPTLPFAVATMGFASLFALTLAMRPRA